MTYAIRTRYVGPTNKTDSRIIASVCERGEAERRRRRLTIHYDPALSSDANHVSAARQLVEKLGWHGEWIGGGDEPRGLVFVCLRDHVRGFGVGFRASADGDPTDEDVSAIFDCATNEGALYPQWVVMARVWPNTHDGAWTDVLRPYVHRLRREKRYDGSASAETIGRAAMLIRDYYIKHVAENDVV